MVILNKAVDILRNYTLPVGIPVRFNGKTIGKVIRNINNGCYEIAINNEEAYSLIRKGQERSFSLEVVRSD